MSVSTSFYTLKSATETIAATVIQAWFRGHRSRNEIADTWLAYVNAVRLCEGPDTGNTSRLPLLKYAESRRKTENQSKFKQDPVSTHKAKTAASRPRANPYVITTSQINTVASGAVAQ